MPGVLLNRSNSTQTEAFDTTNVLRGAEAWLEEPWCDKDPPVYHALRALLAKVRRTLEHRRLHHGNDSINIVLYHEFDSQGNRIPFRRVDFLGALAKWHLYVDDLCENTIDWADAFHTRNLADIVKKAMIQKEVEDTGRSLGEEYAVCIFTFGIMFRGEGGEMLC